MERVPHGDVPFLGTAESIRHELFLQQEQKWNIKAMLGKQMGLECRMLIPKAARGNIIETRYAGP
jgi:hypothetical protein